MAVLAIFSGPTITKEQYEALRREVNWEGATPPGGIFHAVGFGEKGLRVADVWESPETLDQFFKTRLLPAMKKLKIEPPTAEVVPLHNANAYAAARSYEVKAK